MAEDRAKNPKRQPKIKAVNWDKVQEFKPDFPGQSWEEQQHGINTPEASAAKTEAYRNRPRNPHGFVGMIHE